MPSKYTYRVQATPSISTMQQSSSSPQIKLTSRSHTEMYPLLKLATHSSQSSALPLISDPYETQGPRKEENEENPHCANSASLKYLIRLTFGASPVATPLANSTNAPTTVRLLVTYCAVTALTRITQILGSSGPPSCVPSPRSPSHVFSAGE